jgi:hypothetical protein
VNSTVHGGTARLHDLAWVDEPCLATPERALRPPRAPTPRRHHARQYVHPPSSETAQHTLAA